MFPYLVVFLITTFIVYLSERKWKQNKIKKAYIWGLIAVLILSVFAGIRNYDVGTDNYFYVLPGYTQAKRYMNAFSFYMHHDIYQLEPLYLILSYAAAKFFRSPHFIMFVLSLITNLFVYLGIVNLRKNLSISFAWLTYCFVFFNISLNLMRQSVAVAIVFFVFSYGEGKINWKKVTIFLLLASFIHISGLIGFFLCNISSFLIQRSVIRI